MSSRFFDESVDTYVATMRSRNFKARERAFAAAAKLARDRAGAEAVCVDIGVGTGYLSRAIASVGFHVIGCDSSREMLKLAAETLPSADLHLGDAGEFLSALPPESGDLVTCSSVLEYVPDPLSIVRLAAVILRPAGVFAVSLPERLSISRLLDAPFLLRGPKESRYNKQWRNRLGGKKLEAAALESGLRLLYRERFGSFDRAGLRLPFERCRPIATLCLYVFERTSS